MQRLRVELARAAAAELQALTDDLVATQGRVEQARVQGCCRGGAPGSAPILHTCTLYPRTPRRLVAQPSPCLLKATAALACAPRCCAPVEVRRCA